ncbi:MAG: COX15/CtaA family protein [Flavobacteriales bacterium]|nr:COX15/CtaA family protein [Flavobacteriales bacterium]
MLGKIRIWLYVGCALIFIMVLVGGITRLTHSGLSMVDWKLVAGSVPPMNDAEWNEAFEKYKAYPEYKELNFNFTLSDFKSIFWWEYIHRMIGRLLGLVFVVPYLYFAVKGVINKSLNRKLIFMFALGAFQAFLGWFMVKSGLKDEPAVSHFRLAAHLITAFLTCGYIFWVAQSLGQKKIRVASSLKTFQKYGVILLVMVIVQIIWGAFVAGLKAGGAYNTWPLMDGGFYPTGMAEPSLLQALLNGIAGVQFFHRYFAIIVLITTIWLWFRAKSQNIKHRNLLLLAVLIQFVLGIFTLVYAVPIVLGILHQLGAFILLLSVIQFLLQFRFKNESING